MVYDHKLSSGSGEVDGDSVGAIVGMLVGTVVGTVVGVSVKNGVVVAVFWMVGVGVCIVGETPVDTGVLKDVPKGVTVSTGAVAVI